MKIRTQLLVSVLGVVLVGFAAVIFLSYTSSRKIVLSEVYSRAENIKEKYQELFNGYFQTASKVALGMAQVIKVDEGISEEKIHLLLKENLFGNPEIYGMTIFIDPPPKDKGKKLFAPYYYRQGQLLKYVPAESDFNFEAQSWYSEPKRLGGPIWTEPYFDKGAGAIMTTYSVPIYRHAQFIGLATVDINLSLLSDNMNNIQIGRLGYAILVSKTGIFLTHPNPDKYVLKKTIQEVAKDLENEDFAELSSLMIKGRGGSLSLKDPLLGKKTHVTFGKIPSTGYSIALFIPESELLVGINQLSKNIFWISVISTILIVLAIIGISWRLTNPIKVLSMAARKIAKGNLDEEIPSGNTKDEIGELTKDIQTMVQTIKENMAHLEEEKEKFERVFTTMSDAIVATDATWNVINCNKAAHQMLDVSMGVNFIRHLSDNFKCNIQVQDLLDSKKEERNFEIIRPETEQVKEMVFSAVVNTLVDTNDDITAQVLTMRDITHEKHEELSKNTLLSLISHKIMTPITVLLGTAALFQDKVFGDISDQQMEHIQKMASQAGKVQKLVDRLINYVALTKGEPEGYYEDININKFLNDVKNNFQFDTREKSIMVNLNLDCEIKDIKANPQHLSWILKELIENAIKFNQQKTIEIIISAQKKSEDFTVVEVKDNGIGIPSMYHERVFDRFFQVDKDFTGNTEGIGLGLSLVRAIMDRYYGFVCVDSKEGGGSTFILGFSSS